MNSIVMLSAAKHLDAIQRNIPPEELTEHANGLHPARPYRTATSAESRPPARAGDSAGHAGHPGPIEHRRAAGRISARDRRSGAPAGRGAAASQPAAARLRALRRTPAAAGGGSPP